MPAAPTDWEPPATSAAVARYWSPYDYRFPIDDLIRRFKYRGDLVAGKTLTALLAAAVNWPGVRDQPAVVDLLIPVPLHWRRLARRGYNQAALLARGLGRELQCPVRADVVRRRAASLPQSALDPQARARNIAGQFYVARPLAGLRVAMIDDVVTTGSTFAELARVLRRAGCLSIEAWALARTPPDMTL